MQEVLLVGQPDGRIGRSFRIAEGRGHLPRLAGQHLRRIVHGSVERGDGAALQHDVRRQANPDGHQAKHGVPARHSLLVASGRHQFGRRRLTSRQRRGQRIAARQRHGHRKRAGRPLGGVGIEAAADGLFHHRVDIRGGGSHARQVDGFLHLEQLAHVLGVERFLAGEQLVEHQPQRVDIALGGDFRALQLLRRHVGRGAVAHLGAGKLVGDGGQSEIHDDHFAALVHHDVLRLQVAMDHAAVVRRGEPGAQLARRFEGLVGGQAADAQQQVGQVFAVHVFHGDERHAFDFADVVDAADVGVGDLAGHAHFAVEPFQQTRVGRGFDGQEFERHRLAQHQVGGAIDLAHAAAAEQSDDAVAAAQQSAGDEAAFVHEGRRGDVRNAGGRRHGHRG